MTSAGSGLDGDGDGVNDGDGVDVHDGVGRDVRALVSRRLAAERTRSRTLACNRGLTEP